jgi:hypothetical protein
MKFYWKRRLIMINLLFLCKKLLIYFTWI